MRTQMSPSIFDSKREIEGNDSGSALAAAIYYRPHHCFSTT